MPKKYRNLWVFGDSYSTPGFCVEPVDSFWMKTAAALQVEQVINYSWPGNSLDSVVHTVVSESNEYDWEHDFFLIGIPPLVRLTVVSEDSTMCYHRRVFDTAGNELDQQMIACHHGLQNLSFHDDPTAIRFEDPTWTQIQACRTVFLLNAWLDKHDADYLVMNLVSGWMHDSPSSGKFLLDSCRDHPRNILFKDTYYDVNYGVNRPADYDQYGWSGHHGAAGNRCFFEYSISPRLP